MHDLALIETYFRKFTKEFWNNPPDNLIAIDLECLHSMNLLTSHTSDPQPNLTRYFQVVETEEKMTLINHQFIVWIVPGQIEESPVTQTFIALNDQKEPKFELCFINFGVYSKSDLVLSLLEKFLQDIEENNELIRRYQA